MIFLSHRVRRPARMLARAGGFLIVLGAVAPWTYLPIGTARFGVPGVLGWGMLALVLGAWIAARPSWCSGLAGGMVSFVIAWKARQVLPAQVDGVLIALQSRLDPLNALLGHFQLSHFVPFPTIPWRDLRGPGIPLTLAGSVLSTFAGAVLLARSRVERDTFRCIACGYRPRAGRRTAFCVRCGVPLPGMRACRTCHAMAEPGDVCCAICGDPLP